jgi:DNA-binding MarR family transcriptional regulator
LSIACNHEPVTADRPGYQLPFLLLGAFRALVDELHVGLAAQGHPHARPLHGFALQALGPEGATISELGRRLAVSKQAAAKTAKNLEALGYVSRGPQPGDGRATVLTRTAKGDELLALSARSFDRLRRRWARTLGTETLDALEDGLETIAGATSRSTIADFPGLLR